MNRRPEENAEPVFRTVEWSDPRWERDGLRQITAKSPALAQRVDLTLHVPEAARAAGAGACRWSSCCTACMARTGPGL